MIHYLKKKIDFQNEIDFQKKKNYSKKKKNYSKKTKNYSKKTKNYSKKKKNYLIN